MTVRHLCVDYVAEHARAVSAVRRSSRSTSRRLQSRWMGRRADIWRVTASGTSARVDRSAIIKRVYVERGVPFMSGIDAFTLRPTSRMRIRTSSYIARLQTRCFTTGKLPSRGPASVMDSWAGRHTSGSISNGWAASVTVPDGVTAHDRPQPRVSRVSSVVTSAIGHLRQAELRDVYPGT